MLFLNLLYPNSAALCDMNELLNRFDFTEFKLRFNGNLTTIFSLLFDNLVNVTVMQGILAGAGASSSLVTTHLFLGSLSGVIFGNIAIFIFTTYWNIGLEVTIPLGIDAPTVFFMAQAVSSLYTEKVNAGVPSDDALREAWGDGATIVMIMGLVKLALAVLYMVWDFPAHIDQKIFRGCLAGIGIALLGMNNFFGIFEEPLSGLVSLFVLFMVTLPPPESLGWRNLVVF